MTAYLEGREADVGEAAQTAAEILMRSRLPLIYGLGTDMAGAQAALALARRLGAVVDHAASEGLIRQMRLLRESGLMTTTPGQARNRPDLIVILGKQPLGRDPGLLSRLMPSEEGLPRPGKGPRKLLLIGAGDASAPGNLQKRTTVLEGGDVVSMVGLLGAGIADRPVAELKTKLAKALSEALELLQTAVSTLFVYAPDELDLAVQQGVLDLVRALNAKARATTLPVGGSGNVIGVNQVVAWNSGFPLRTRVTEASAEHDPWLYDGKRMLASGDADALLWIDAFGQQNRPKAKRGVPVVSLSSAETDGKAAVAIEVATPGKDHAAALYSSDLGAVAWMEATDAKTDKPQVADVLNRILAAMGKEGRS